MSNRSLEPDAVKLAISPASMNELGSDLLAANARRNSATVKVGDMTFIAGEWLIAGVSWAVGSPAEVTMIRVRPPGLSPGYEAYETSAAVDAILVRSTITGKVVYPKR